MLVCSRAWVRSLAPQQTKTRERVAPAGLLPGENQTHTRAHCEQGRGTEGKEKQLAQREKPSHKLNNPFWPAENFLSKLPPISPLNPCVAKVRPGEAIVAKQGLEPGPNRACSIATHLDTDQRVSSSPASTLGTCPPRSHFTRVRPLGPCSSILFSENFLNMRLAPALGDALG